jgi:hypothetical protein
MAIAVTPRSVGMMLAATVFAGWFESVSSPDTVQRDSAPQQSSRVQGGRARGEAPTTPIVPDTTRLREWMNSPPMPSRGRNPFVYGSRMQARAAAREMEAPVDAPPPAPIEPAMPVFKLSGIASNSEGGTLTLTAIIIDNGSMVFAKAGEKLSNGYSVVEVSEGAVTLVDASGVTQTIRLP